MATSVARLAALAVAEVLQELRIHLYREVVRLERPQRNKTCRHAPAVQVAAYVTAHIGNAFFLKVVVGGEVKVPVFGGLEATIKAKVVPPLVFVLPYLGVKVTPPQREAVIKAQVPVHFIH